MRGTATPEVEERSKQADMTNVEYTFANQVCVILHVCPRLVLTQVSAGLRSPGNSSRNRNREMERSWGGRDRADTLLLLFCTCTALYYIVVNTALRFILHWTVHISSLHYTAISFIMELTALHLRTV